MLGGQQSNHQIFFILRYNWPFDKLSFSKQKINMLHLDILLYFFIELFFVGNYI